MQSPCANDESKRIDVSCRNEQRGARFCARLVPPSGTPQLGPGAVARRGPFSQTPPAEGSERIQNAQGVRSTRCRRTTEQHGGRAFWLLRSQPGPPFQTRHSKAAPSLSMLVIASGVPVRLHGSQLRMISWSASRAQDLNSVEARRKAGSEGTVE